MNKVRKFFSELRRRKVVRTVGAYIAVFWLLAQGFAVFSPAFGLPALMLRLFVFAGIGLLPVVAWLSWKYNITPPQIVRDPSDADSVNPLLGWALHRHDNTDAGYILLKWQDSADKVNEKRFFKALSLGRGPDNDVQLPDERVSRHHAVLWAEDGAWHVRDSSTNGTYINHARIAGSALLPSSCELQFHAGGPVVSVYIDKPAQTMVS
jgi:hypothetical protein